MLVQQRVVVLIWVDGSSSKRPLEGNLIGSLSIGAVVVVEAGCLSVSGREVVVRLIVHEGALVQDIRMGDIVAHYEPDLRLPAARRCSEVRNIQAGGPVAADC